VRDSGAAERPQDRTAELSLFRRYGRPTRQSETRGPDGKFRPHRLVPGITETLGKVEAAGFSEVILYFNVGLKAHSQVKEEMERFMREVTPAFEGAHKQRAA